jgi:hypothetical protein
MCPALGELIESLLCQKSALDEVQVFDGLGILKCKLYPLCIEAPAH